jgi:potassium channel subfamily K
MNDPGLDKPIFDDAKDVENQMGGQQEEEDREDEESYLEPR